MRVQHPTKGLHSGIANIDHTRDVVELNVTSHVPLLYCKVLDVNVMRSCHGLAFIDHSNGGLVVHVERCWLGLNNTELSKNWQPWQH